MAAHLLHCRGLVETLPATLKEAASLAAAAAPESAPYDKKYEARTLLQSQCELIEEAIGSAETPRR